MSPLEIKKLVAVLVAAYPNSKISEESVGVYVRMLADLDYPAANAAVEQLLASSKWMPTVSEIRERVVSLHRGEILVGGEAWGLVLKAIGRYGRYRVPGVDFKFDDPTTAECVSALNWRELCDSENPQADRARFVELYDRLAARNRRAELTDGLPATKRFRELQAQQSARALSQGEPEEPQAQTMGTLLKLVLKADRP